MEGKVHALEGYGLQPVRLMLKLPLLPLTYVRPKGRTLHGVRVMKDDA